MYDLISEIARADKSEIQELLEAFLHRYAVLFPEWEVTTISLPRDSDRNAQLDRIITMLQNMKTTP